jgi:hypothetical protein
LDARDVFDADNAAVDTVTNVMDSNVHVFMRE